ncbi:hypothetical protein V6N12_063400 [Hibiscus sabdariffa]|uniref:Protein kinase domain-containing protein n=2 Tax=Hibiscus sabdariffa TaxID=183260 RepID=A0ABR2FBL8_9ROSI
MQLNLPPLFHLNASFLTYRSSESATIASFLSSWQCLSGECWANGTATGPLLQYEWLIGSQYKPVELAKSDWVAIRKAPPWAIDSWGCLIYEIFSGMKLGETEELRDTSIPKPLLPDYQRLLSSLPSRRLNTSKLIDNSEIFQNKLVDTVHFMEILSLKDSVERDTFFRKLPTLAEQLRCQIVLNKIFPLLTSALEYGSAAAPALNALLKTGSRLSVEEFYLKHIVQYGEPLSAQVVDDQVYPHVATGLPIEVSFKVEEPAIRTNTTILLGNIASYLNMLEMLFFTNRFPMICEPVLLYSSNKVGLGNREIVGLRTKKQQLTCNREMRKTWNEEATIHICDESENYNLSRDLKSFLFHAIDKNFAYVSLRQQRDSRTPNKKATTHMQQRDETDWNEEATIHICDENTIHSYFSGKKAPYTGVVNLAYVSPRFLLGSQSFVMDASERSKFIVNLECPGDIIRFCNNAFKHCNDHLRNTGVLGHHKKDIESLSGMVHGNACLESVVVMRTLDWKLHAFDVLSEYDGAKWNCYRTIAVNLLFVKTAIVSRKREELNRLRPEEPNTSSG